jgi:hypothetical protein
MTQFDVSYDRQQFVTVEDVIGETGKAALLVNKALKDSGLVGVGYVRTGRVGKPPRLFERAAFFAAIAAYEDQRNTLRTARVSARVRAAAPVVAAPQVNVSNVPPPANDDVNTTVSAAAVVFGE